MSDDAFDMQSSFRKQPKRTGKVPQEMVLVSVIGEVNADSQPLSSDHSKLKTPLIGMLFTRISEFSLFRGADNFHRWLCNNEPRYREQRLHGSHLVPAVIGDFEMSRSD